MPDQVVAAHAHAVAPWRTRRSGHRGRSCNCRWRVRWCPTSSRCPGSPCRTGRRRRRSASSREIAVGQRGAEVPAVGSAAALSVAPVAAAGAAAVAGVAETASPVASAAARATVRARCSALSAGSRYMFRPPAVVPGEGAHRRRRRADRRVSGARGWGTADRRLGAGPGRRRTRPSGNGAGAGSGSRGQESRSPNPASIPGGKFRLCFETPLRSAAADDRSVATGADPGALRVANRFSARVLDRWSGALHRLLS